MTRFKKIVSMLLVVIMVMSLLPLSVIAEDIQSTHTVQFKLNYNGAHKIPSQKVADGECAVQPEDVTREGWIFEYWYVKTENNGIQKFDLSQPITEDVTLYARWMQDIEYWGPIWNRNILGAIEDSKDDEENADGTYTVTFDANADGVVGMPENQKVAAGECASEPVAPVRSGYLFSGWYSDSDTLVPFNFNTAIYGDITLYAKWIGEYENDDPTLYSITEVIFDEETGEINFRTQTGRSCELHYYVIEDEGTKILYESTIPATENLNGEYLTDTIPISVLPMYYKVTAVLTDSTGKPLCDQYIYYEKTKVYIDFMAKTIFDFPSESVINLDTSYDNNFMVANKETDIFIHPEFSTKFDKDTNTYVFSGNISELDALSRGDQLAILTEDNAYALQIESLYVSENEITVKAYDEVYLAQFFDYVKINQEVDVSQTDVFPEQQSRKARAQLNASTDIPLPTIDIGEVNIDIKVGIGVEFVLNFERSSNFYEVKLSMKLSSNGKIGGELKEWGDSVPEYRDIVPRFVVPLSIPGLAAESGTQLFFKKSAELTIETGLKIGMVFGYQCSSYGNKPIFEPVFEIDDPNINLSGAIEFGLSPYVGVTFLGGLISLDYNNDIGIELKGELKTDLGVDVPGDPAVHMCRQCLGVTLTPFYRPNISGRINLLVNPIQVPNEITTVKFNQGKAFMSLINDEDTLYKGNVTWGFGECQNYKYLIDLQALNTTTGEKNLNARIYNSENAKVHDGGTGINKYFYTGTYISEVEYNNVWHDTGIFSVKKAGDVILEISGKGKVEFIVVADGVTVDDYTFEIYNHSNKFICGYSSNDPLVRPADGSGFCSILLPYGDYQLHVHADGYTTESGNKTSITYFKVEEDTEFVDVELIKNICRGYLVDRVYGNGVAYADVRVLDEHGNVFEDTSSPIGVFTTDLTGNGKYQIEIKSPYYYPFEEQFIVTKGKYDFKKIELDPLEDASLSGRFVNVNGQPVVGVTIYAKSRFDDSITNTESDADGYFQLSLPDWGIYDISYESEKYIANNYTSIYVDRAESLGDIVLKDIPNFSITHTSTDGTTTDILAASPIEVYNGVASMTWTISSSEPWKIVTNRGDWFSLSVDGKSVGLNSTFDAGETELKLNISKYTDSRNDGTIAFEVGGETHTVEIFQKASIIASLTGTIKDGDADSPTYGQVLEGVSLDVYDSAGKKVGGTAKSNENGVVAFDFPAAGIYKFVFSLVGYETMTVDTVNINENTPSLGSYELMKAEYNTSVSGTTTPGTKLELLDENGNVIAETTADENGNYDFGDIPGWDGTIFRIRIKDTTITVDVVSGATGIVVDATVTIFTVSKSDTIQTVSKPDTVQIGNEVGATSEWEIESSHAWSVTATGDTSWYTLSTTTGKCGITEFTVTANSATDAYRESVLTFALNNRTFDVKIYQDIDRTAVSGTTSPGTKLELLNENGNVLDETVADEDGKYEFTDIPGLDGTIFRIRIKDTTITVDTVGGATGVVVDTTITIFTVSKPDIVQINNEVGAISEWEIESSHAWSVTATGDTSWYTLSSTSGKCGTTEFTVTANSVTDAYRESVLTFALNNRTFEVTIYQDIARTTVSGTTSPGTKLELLDENGNVIAETTADENGNYDFGDIPGWDGTIFIVRIKDTTLTTEVIGGATDVVVDASRVIFIPTISYESDVKLENTDGASTEWKIETSHPWTVTKSGDTSWYTLNTESGNAGISDFVVTAIGTTDSYRESTLTFALNNRTFDVTIYQNFVKTVSGSVVEQTENSAEVGIENVEIVVRKADDSSLYSQTKTDVNGQYTLVFEDAGEYVITAEKSGYTTVMVDYSVSSETTEIEKISMVKTVSPYYFNGHTYLPIFPSESYISWDDAEAICQSFGGHLVSITSEDENNFIKVLTEDGLSNGITTITRERWWIGAHKENGSWAWSDGDSFGSYTNWIGEPESAAMYGFMYSKTNDSQSGYWQNIQDDETQYAGLICEWDYEIDNIEGVCNNDLKWQFAIDGTLTISGEGVLDNNGYSTAPWKDLEYNITKVELTSGITEIGQYGFTDTYYATEVILPDTLKTINEYSSYVDSGYRKNYTVSADNTAYTSADGVLFTKDMSTLVAYPQYNERTEYSIPDGVNVIKSLNGNALQIINIPASVSDWDAEYENFSSLQKFNVDSDNTVFASIDGVLFNKSGNSLVKYPRARFAENNTYRIPDGVTIINNGAFYEFGITDYDYDNWNDPIGSIIFPASVTTIGYNNFFFEEYYHYPHMNLYFEGNAPVIDGYYNWDNSEKIVEYATVYYTAGKSGWTSPNWYPSYKEWSSETKLTNIRIPTILQDAYTTVSGQVVDESGAPLENVKVQGKYGDELTGIAYTDSDGNYTFQFESATTCDFRYYLSGYETVFVDTVAIEVGEYLLDTVTMTTGVSVLGSGTTGGGNNWTLQENELIIVCGESNSSGMYYLSSYDNEAIQEYSFWSPNDMMQIKKLNISEGITKLRISDISDDLSVEELYIGADVCEIEWSGNSFVHDYRYGNTDIVIDSANTNYVITDGALYTSDHKTLLLAPQNNYSITTYSIREGVEVVGEYAFNGAYYKTISIPNTVSTLKSSSFFNCDLESIHIPASVTSIDGNVFESCRSLSVITVDAANTEYMAADNILYNKAQTMLITVPCALTGTLSIPNGVNSIASLAMYSTKLDRIIIPTSVANIDRLAIVPYYSNITCKVYFLGGVPNTVSEYSFGYDFEGTLYYLAGSSGWSTPTTVINGTTYNTQPFTMDELN